MPQMNSVMRGKTMHCTVEAFPSQGFGKVEYTLPGSFGDLGYGSGNKYFTGS